ncbi:hypothetical protein DM860_003822 [Cuscuta australis]|uniref:Uncharacterized protein n=1 Tax=Cuscuta australis TaxID=267555 RepID=A0A328DM12_9ASTE|nr:hypothetical protein DM860_003822 [Cuscuta australis]
MYVRDLELKSKYFESECTRLGVMLQFCLAENQALRFYLENNNKKAVGASSPRQESAVLLLESLLFGSLLWSLGIIFTCLFILPSRLLSTLLRVLPQKGQEDQNQASRIKAGREQKSIRICVFPTMMGKRYKASRSRLKYCGGMLAVWGQGQKCGGGSHGSVAATVVRHQCNHNGGD